MIIYFQHMLMSNYYVNNAIMLMKNVFVEADQRRVLVYDYDRAEQKLVDHDLLNLFMRSLGHTVEHFIKSVQKMVHMFTIISCCPRRAGEGKNHLKSNFSTEIFKFDFALIFNFCINFPLGTTRQYIGFS
ncbi:hypothetical protein BpHYR1_009573 [Brachionus plicatilis]|uniref:Uncharacterized protein n=1 Tax=Brachionus plicatilis TaxID=10195 RepID=A0A3M7T913_BRAPC|nr:hypothetical protein BpHYR1_009573 [Brachionus plicatilis]